MGSEWKNTTLGEVVNFRRGHDLPKTKMTGGNIPVMGSNGVIGFHDTATSKAPGVTIGRSGNVGNPQLCEVDSWAHNTTLYVDDFKGNDPLFIFHFLKTLNLENFRGGSAVPTLNRNHIHPIDVTIPPLPEQKRIAHILGTLDDKIELNRKMNATLEAMAQALFKSWFVDFDPVIDNALRAGNPIPEPLQQRAETRRKILGERSSSCVTTSKDGAGAPSLPDPHSHLFPATFTHSEDLGWMPEGWEAGTISDLCSKVQNGGTPRRSNEDYWNNGSVPWLTSGEVRQAVITTVKNSISELGLQNSSAKWLPKRSTVVAMYGATAGQVAFISQPLTTNQAVCGLIPKEGHEHFNYLLIQGKVKHFENQARGSAQQNISKGIIEQSASIIPPLNLIQLFELLACPSFEKWSSNIRLNTELSKLRDTLLPKLISGDLIPSNSRITNKKSL